MKRRSHRSRMSSLFGGGRQVGRRDVFRLHRVERGQPRPGDLVVGYPLRDSALGKPGNSHHLGPAAHDLDDIGSVHG